MPSKSAAQAKLMRAVAHNPAFAKKVGVPQSVGQEFMKADKRKMKKFELGGPTSYAESGSAGGTNSFKDAFKAARKAGQGTFTWQGKKYTTEMAGEKKAAPAAAAKPADKPAAPEVEVAASSVSGPRSGGRGSKPGSAKVGTGRHDDPTSSYMDRVFSPFKRLTGGDLFGQREVERVAKGAGVSTEEARRRIREAGMRGGGSIKKYRGGGMPDLTGDGKVTRADVLKGRGVFNRGGGIKKYAGGGSVSRRADGIASRGKTRCKIV